MTLPASGPLIQLSALGGGGNTLSATNLEKTERLNE